MSKERQLCFHEKAMNKMFQMVGFEAWDRELTKQGQWYAQREWTLEKEAEFASWYATEIRKDLQYPKYKALNAAAAFLLRFGWKTKTPTNAGAIVLA